MAGLRERLEEHNESSNTNSVLGIFNLTTPNKLSGPRQHMVSGFYEQMLMLDNPEIPRMFTGYEKEYAQYNDSLDVANTDYVILYKIDKYPNVPGFHYTLILQDINTGVVSLKEVTHYQNLTENHGYVKPRTSVDDRLAGGTIRAGEVIARSNSHDEFLNYRYGVNANVAYISHKSVIQDGVAISQSFADRVTYHQIETVRVTLNFNDILMNYYGDENNYLCFPEIGQETKDGILCVRRTFDQASIRSMGTVKMLSKVCIDDEPIAGNGRILDVNIYCNSFNELRKDIASHGQISRYLDIITSYKKRVVDAIRTCEKQKMKITALTKHVCDKYSDFLYAPTDRDERVKFYSDTGKFEFMYMEFTVAKQVSLGNGSKVTNRFGGKGVVCEVIPDEFMPVDKYGTRAEVILNPCSIVKRSNPAQLYETELNYIAKRVCDQISKMANLDEKYRHLLKFYQIVDKEFAEFFERWYRTASLNEKRVRFSQVEAGEIYVRQHPFDNISFEGMKQLYTTFDVKPHRVNVVKQTKFGKKTYKSKNAVVIGSAYIMVLKHTTDNKFSVVSVGDMDTKGVPLKPSNKNKTSSIRKTPIKFGTMETNLGIIKAGADIIKRFLAAGGLNIRHREDVASMLLTHDPFTYHNVPVESVKNNVGSDALVALMRQMGYSIYTDKINNTIDVGILQE